MLYFVSTSIGNLEDISIRAINTLKSVDVIACEDTRHSKILLDNYGILAKTIAYHKFNENVSADGIISLLKDGKNVAIYKDKNGIEHIVLNKCPHMKCGIVLNEVEQTWDCYCHGSRFDRW